MSVNQGRMDSFMYVSKPHADILPGVSDLSGGTMARSLADMILALGFPEEEAARVEQLNGKATEDRLTEEEEAELEAYIITNKLLTYWQSRAHQTLPQPV